MQQSTKKENINENILGLEQVKRAKWCYKKMPIKLKVKVLSIRGH